jgi:mannosyltransferase OCH1-like enzyme
MSVIILITRWMIKLLANALKLGCYIYHAIFPKSRFTIPVTADALVKVKASLPRKILWQTNFTNRVTLPVYLNYLFNRLMSPTYSYRFVSDQEAADFVKEHYPPKVSESYLKLQIGAAKADFWRVLVLQKCGGVYLDMDAHLVWPLERIFRPGQEELYLKIKTGEISNYFIASKSNNDNLAKVIEKITNNIVEGAWKDVYNLTGPGVFNDVFSDHKVPTRFYKYTCNQGNFTNEFFQYIDKPQGKWTREQETIDVIRQGSGPV